MSNLINTGGYVVVNPFTFLFYSHMGFHRAYSFQIIRLLMKSKHYILVCIDMYVGPVYLSSYTKLCHYNHDNIISVTIHNDIVVKSKCYMTSNKTGSKILQVCTTCF